MDVPILVVGGPMTKDKSVAEVFIERARAEGWRVLGMDVFVRSIPEGPEYVGAVTSSRVEAQRARDAGIRNIVRITHKQHAHEPFSPRGSQVGVVYSDTDATGRVAAEHFAERRLKHVAYVGYDPMRGSKLLYESFKARAEQLGCRCHTFLWDDRDDALTKTITKPSTRKNMLEAVAEWLPTLPRPIGYLGYHCPMAASVCHICMSRGIAVPEEVAILGANENFGVCETAPVPISSVGSSTADEVRAALLLLKRMLDGGEASGPWECAVKPGLIVRRSTDVMAVEDPLAARALRFMWDNMGSPLSVTDVARAVNVSRRNLERVFSESLGRGVAWHLRVRRVEACKTMLRETDMTVAEIAKASGIGRPEHLHRLFRKTLGVTPTQFRERERNEFSGGVVHISPAPEAPPST